MEEANHRRRRLPCVVILAGTARDRLRRVVTLAVSSLDLRSGNRRLSFSRHIAKISESDAEKFVVYLVVAFLDRIRLRRLR